MLIVGNFVFSVKVRRWRAVLALFGLFGILIITVLTLFDTNPSNVSLGTFGYFAVVALFIPIVLVLIWFHINLLLNLSIVDLDSNGNLNWMTLLQRKNIVIEPGRKVDIGADQLRIYPPLIDQKDNGNPLTIRFPKSGVSMLVEHGS